MKSLKPRLMTAFIGIPLLVLILFTANFWTPIIGIVSGVASAFMVGEYLNANKLLKLLPLSVPCVLFAFTLPIIINIPAVYPVVFGYLILIFAVMIAKHKDISYGKVTYAVAGTLLISFGMSGLPRVCDTEYGVSFFFVVVFALPWMADAGGFFIGAAFGKHKLCPNISPKKTVEGAVGGVVFCVAAAIISGVLFQYIFTTELKFNYFALALLGLAAALLSIVGDLSFSLIKRSLHIKDYGSIFPGHGGMLDRFDSIIFTAPAIYIINKFMPFFSMVN